jgi:hypothetical protein
MAPRPKRPNSPPRWPPRPMATQKETACFEVRPENAYPRSRGSSGRKTRRGASLQTNTPFYPAPMIPRKLTRKVRIHRQHRQHRQHKTGDDPIKGSSRRFGRGWRKRQRPETSEFTAAFERIVTSAWAHERAAAFGLNDSALEEACTPTGSARCPAPTWRGRPPKLRRCTLAAHRIAASGR